MPNIVQGFGGFHCQVERNVAYIFIYSIVYVYKMRIEYIGNHLLNSHSDQNSVRNKNMHSNHILFLSTKINVYYLF